MEALPTSFNLADYYLFDRLAEGAGGRTALRFGERAWTYAEVADRSRRMAAAYAAAGLHPGERVYLVLADVPPFAWAFFGALKAGLVVTLGNPLTPTATLADVVDYVDARAVVTTPAVAAELGAALAGRAVFLVPDAGTFDDPEAPVADARCLATTLAATPPATTTPATHRDSPAIWLFTSGSTGRPKAAMHCHRDFAFNTEVYAKKTLGWAAEDVGVSVPRLFFGYATGTNLMFPFAVGGCAALFSEKPTPERVAWAVAYYRATVLTNVPTLMAKLLEADAEGADVDLTSLRFCLSAGEALPPALLERWLARFGVPVYDGIGSAEMFHIYLTNRPGDVRGGALGRPVEGYTLRILPADAEGPGAEPVPTGELGVLWVRGDSVAQGYWLDRDTSWQTFHGHWCRTGDLFRVDEDGYYWFSGRADALLKVAGQWVSPLEVEDCLLRHPAVREAAVIGVERGGLMLTRAVVAVRTPVSAEELQDWVKDRLARYKYPREVVFVDALPRGDRGKVDRGALPR
ncbi:MAG: benzoate-CoA ligase family protein [Myxococcales bacterium]|nr:benzoate-CoA ligase family protein [Myxococcales bacterium]